MSLLFLGNVSSQFMAKYNGFLKEFNENAGSLLWDALISIIILLLAKVVLRTVSSFTTSVMSKNRAHLSPDSGKRLNSLMTLLRSTLRYLIYFVALLLILRQFNLFESMRGLVVTAGIGSVALGFGAQSLVKDVVTGLFMMFENQFSVGDYIRTDEAEGTVEATAVRVTYLRTYKGEQVIIPNGSISRVVNYSRGDNLAMVIVPVPYEHDTRKIFAILEEAGKKYAEENPDNIIEAPTIQGIRDFGASGVEIGVICKVQSMTQWMVERELRLAIKEALEQHGITLPYPRVAVEKGLGGSPNAPEKEILPL